MKKQLLQKYKKYNSLYYLTFPPVILGLWDTSWFIYHTVSTSTTLSVFQEGKVPTHSLLLCETVGASLTGTVMPVQTAQSLSTFPCVEISTGTCFPTSPLAPPHYPLWLLQVMLGATGSPLLCWSQLPRLPTGECG